MVGINEAVGASPLSAPAGAGLAPPVYEARNALARESLDVFVLPADGGVSLPGPSEPGGDALITEAELS
eukprot:IDg21467t1